jgi:hypothetical protein
MALSVDLGNGDSAAKTFAGLRTELAKEKPLGKRLKLKMRLLLGGRRFKEDDQPVCCPNPRFRRKSAAPRQQGH